MRAASFSCVGRYASLVPHGNSSILFILSLQRFWAVFALFGLSVFVVFCRICSHKTDKAVAYNRGMEYLDRYIPKEYLALKINFCKRRLEQLPKVKLCEYYVSGVAVKRLMVGKHRYNLASATGQKYYAIGIERKKREQQLQIYLAIWDSHYKGEPLTECAPHKITRTLRVSTDKCVILNKAFFDSLENDANKDHPKYSNYFCNGIYYRSAAERDIAIFYTEMGIPFKYEPNITLFGLNKPIHTDFVIYIEELDTCIFHEHFGMKDSSDYLRTTKVKYGNYTNAGLIPELDILFTHDVEDMPFDIRYLPAKLNTAIYGLTIMPIPQGVITT